MFVRRWCVVLLLLVSGVPCAIGAQQQRAAMIPANVDAGLLTPDMIALLRRSETFRAQCERLARSPHVRVKIDMALSVDSARAQTTIHRFTAGAILAEVEVAFGENYRELLGHEFEHILEQIDGVDLRQEAAEGRAWLLPDGAFETRRAFAVGLQVSREAEPRARAVAVSATR